MRLLVCGPRDWSDKLSVWSVLDEYLDQKPHIITGASRGVDTFAIYWAQKHGLSRQDFVPKWDKYGRAAGPIRNQQMLDFGKPDLVLAFQVPGEETAGTQDMIRRAQKAGIPTIVEY